MLATVLAPLAVARAQWTQETGDPLETNANVITSLQINSGWAKKVGSKATSSDWVCTTSIDPNATVEVRAVLRNDSQTEWTNINWQNIGTPGPTNNLREFPLASARLFAINPLLNHLGAPQTLNLWVAGATLTTYNTEVQQPGSFVWGTNYTNQQFPTNHQILGRATYDLKIFYPGITTPKSSPERWGVANKTSCIAQLAPPGIGTLCPSGWMFLRYIKASRYRNSGTTTDQTVGDWGPDNGPGGNPGTKIRHLIPDARIVCTITMRLGLSVPFLAR